jgi:hypothetical protein
MSNNSKDYYKIVIDLPEYIIKELKENYPKSFSSYSAFLRHNLEEYIQNPFHINYDTETIFKHIIDESTKVNNFSFYISIKFKQDFLNIALSNLRTPKSQAALYVYTLYHNLINVDNQIMLEKTHN